MTTIRVFDCVYNVCARESVFAANRGRTHDIIIEMLTEDMNGMGAVHNRMVTVTLKGDMGIMTTENVHVWRL